MKALTIFLFALTFVPAFLLLDYAAIEARRASLVRQYQADALEMRGVK